MTLPRYTPLLLKQYAEVRRLHALNPTWSDKRLGDAVGINRQAARRHRLGITKMPKAKALGR